MKPRIFIGSSTKALPIANAVQVALTHGAEPIVWNQRVFRGGSAPIETLTRVVNEYDFGVFVFLPEDELNMRGVDELAVRDNVIFELGLFIATLGRERNFFITPRGKDVKVYLPSDLAGIVTNEYDADAANRAAAVVPALFDLNQAIDTMGSRQHAGREYLLYDGGESTFRDFHFTGWNGCFWRDDKEISPQSDGEMSVSSDGIIEVHRRSTEGRFEVTFRPSGRYKPSILRKFDAVERVIRMELQAKVDEGEHAVRFILKNAQTDRWEADRKVTISSAEWQPLTVRFRVTPLADLVVRIDDERPSVSPSTIRFRNIRIVEEPVNA